MTGWAVTVLTGAIVLLLAAFGSAAGGSLGAALAGAFKLVCHQIADRSFVVGGEVMLVCHRCTGILIGILAGAVSFPLMQRMDGFLWRFARSVVVLSLVPIAIDWSLDFAGLLANTPVSRMVTGLVFGVAAGYFVTRGTALRRRARSVDHTRGEGGTALIRSETSPHQP